MRALWVPKVKSVIDLGPNHLHSIFLNFFSSITTHFNISSAIRWAIQDQWSSGFIVKLDPMYFRYHFDVYFHCFGDMSLSPSLRVFVSLSVSQHDVLFFICLNVCHEGWCLDHMRPTGGSGPVGLVKPSIGITYEISLMCDVVVRYIWTVYIYSWYLLGTWSQNLVSVPCSGHTGTRNESMRMSYRFGNTISIARLDGARRRPVWGPREAHRTK